MSHRDAHAYLYNHAIEIPSWRNNAKKERSVHAPQGVRRRTLCVNLADAEKSTWNGPPPGTSPPPFLRLGEDLEQRGVEVTTLAPTSPDDCWEF